MSDVQMQSSGRGEPEASELVIRPMHLDDVDEVALLERLIFPLPWSRHAFIEEVGDSATSFCLVARRGKLLAGYLVAWFIVDEAHLGNVAVNPDFRRQSVARELMKRLREEALRRSVQRISLEVRVSNTAAICLYKEFGFKAVSIRKGYYVDNKEDAFVMLCELGSLENPMST